MSKLTTFILTKIIIFSLTSLVYTNQPPQCPLNPIAKPPQKPSLLAFTKRIYPPRAFHANGAGAHGSLLVTNDISRYTCSTCCNKVGKVTPVLVRFSTNWGDFGSPDLPLNPPDVRGMAIKFYTESGNWDLHLSNRPVSPIRNPLLFTQLEKSRTRHKRRHTLDPNAWWDFQSSHPETTMQAIQLFSDLAYSDGWRHMDGLNPHSTKLVNATGGGTYAKFHFISASPHRGKNFTYEQARLLPPDYAKTDLYNAIETGNFPKWNVFIQVMNFEQSTQATFDPHDPTKIWPLDKYPLVTVGVLTLDRNPEDYYKEIELAAFGPGNLIPGLEISPDKVFLARLMAYPIAQRIRLGINHQDIFVSTMQGVKGKGNPEHFRRGYKVPKDPDDWKRPVDDFSQAKDFYESLTKRQQKTLAENIVRWLEKSKGSIRKKTIKIFSNVSHKLAHDIQEAIGTKQKK